MNITTDEISAVWDSLDLAVRQAVFIAVLEQRNRDLEQDQTDLRHTVEVLERAVRGNGNLVTVPNSEMIMEH